MQIAVVHDTLNPCGGAERLSLYMIKALRELGYEVDLVLMEKTSWGRVKAIFGEDLRNYITNEITVPPFRKVMGIYGRYVEWFLRDIVNFTTKLKKQYDIIIITKQLHVPVFADIIYMHFPDFYPGVESLYYPERYVYNTFLRIYSLPSHIISNLLIELFKYSRYKPLILTNSKFSKVLIKRWLGVNALVLHPPVALEKFETASRNSEKENTVVTIGRIEQGKNLHLVPLIASKVPDFNFIIVGSSSQERYRRYLNKLIKELKVQDRVSIVTSASEATLIKVLSRARYYLHTTMYEHFGVAVVEAMAAGAIPIVHKKSGAWTDILEKGEYGYGYQNQEDIVEILRNFSKGRTSEHELYSKIKMRARAFSYNSFKTKVKYIIERVLESENR